MIGVDWGTSSVRAFRLAADGAVVGRISAQLGILHVENQDFAGTLRRQLAGWLADGERRILLSGMVGSRQGWVEAPYLPCPAGAAELARHLTEVPFDAAQVKLVPGLSCRDAAGMPEVMRGEETQIVGALAQLGPDALICLPGSHSKWVTLAQSRVTGFATYFSGEAYAALRQATILGRMMRDGPLSATGFARGVAHSATPGHLLHHLFGVRSQGLFGELADTDSAGYLSGLLIGHELRAALPPRAQVTLIGAAELCAWYDMAIVAMGGQTRRLDPDCAAAGLAAIGGQATWG